LGAEVGKDRNNMNVKETRCALYFLDQNGFQWRVIVKGVINVWEFRDGVEFLHNLRDY
jgi:hypothetical protein